LKVLPSQRDYLAQSRETAEKSFLSVPAPLREKLFMPLDFFPEFWGHLIQLIDLSSFTFLGGQEKYAEPALQLWSRKRDFTRFGAFHGGIKNSLRSNSLLPFSMEIAAPRLRCNGP